jgi:hypothetical protein
MSIGYRHYSENDRFGIRNSVGSARPAMAKVFLVVLGFARDWLHIAISAAYVARSMKAGFSSGRSFLKTFHFDWRFA